MQACMCFVDMGVASQWEGGQFAGEEGGHCAWRCCRVCFRWPMGGLAHEGNVLRTVMKFDLIGNGAEIRLCRFHIPRLTEVDDGLLKRAADVGMLLGVAQEIIIGEQLACDLVFMAKMTDDSKHAAMKMFAHALRAVAPVLARFNTAGL